MRDSGNAEESLRPALSDLAATTGPAVASDRVRQVLRAEVRAHGHRRRAMQWMGVAAALACLLLGATIALRKTAAPQRPKLAAAPKAVQPGPAAREEVAQQEPAEELAVSRDAARPRTARPQQPVTGEWRAAEAALTPWYYNTALPPSARTTLVKFDADAEVASRFGVASQARKVPAEVLLGEDGLPRAIRFVQRPKSRKD